MFNFTLCHNVKKIAFPLHWSFFLIFKWTVAAVTVRVFFLNTKIPRPACVIVNRWSRPWRKCWALSVPVRFWPPKARTWNTSETLKTTTLRSVLQGLDLKMVLHWIRSDTSQICKSVFSRFSDFIHLLVQWWWERDSWEELFFLWPLVTEEPCSHFQGQLHQTIWWQLWTSFIAAASHGKAHTCFIYPIYCKSMETCWFVIKLCLLCPNVSESSRAFSTSFALHTRGSWRMKLDWSSLTPTPKRKPWQRLERSQLLSIRATGW